MDLFYTEGVAKFSELSSNRTKQILMKNKIILLNLKVSNERYSFMPCWRYLHIGSTKQNQSRFCVHSASVADSVACSRMSLSWKAPAARRANAWSASRFYASPELKITQPTALNAQEVPNAMPWLDQSYMCGTLPLKQGVRAACWQRCAVTATLEKETRTNLPPLPSPTAARAWSRYHKLASFHSAH